MATAQQIKALLKSYSEADAAHFVSVAMQIAAHEARSGRAKMAAELKKLIDDIQEKQRQGGAVGAVPIARPKGELANLLAASYPKTRLSEMVLSPEQRESLERVLLEYRQLSKLQEYALTPRRKLLLIGPPGVGKTMTSWALAGELKLPHFTVQFHSLITKYMGETAAKLHAIFEAMQHTRGVYLFDEFDAIGGERAGSNDVGEIRRVLNSFLQFLEQDESDSLILAATNLDRMLDDALYRRFDDVITYHLPTREELKRLFVNRLSAFRTESPIDFEVIASAAEGLSHADVCKACQDAAKDAVLHDRREIDSNVLLKSLQRRRRKQHR
jgi:SpoVK/Ycf46/Vps4 family AAA+-type ATPase